MLSSTTALLLALVSSGALAQNNDWTKPCLDGQCFWDLPASSGVSGTMRVWGDSTAISDITAAAGWTILNCKPDALTQDIRLVCTGAAADCDHLFQAGATNTVVRLPTSCGKSPFALVTRSWVHADQSVPANVARQLARRDEPALVQGLALTTSFDKADPGAADVNVAISGTTVPGQTGNLTVTPPRAAPARRSRLQDRGFFSFIENAFKKFNSFDKDITKSLPPIDVDKSFPLFSQSISCPKPAVSASISADVNAKAHAVVSLGMSAVGKIIPPSLSEFGVFVGLDADLTGTMQLKGTATGRIDTGLVDVFSAGIPGLDFPGILTIGPTFKIQAQATASLDVNVDATVVLAYRIDNAKLFFPRSDSLKSGGNFNPADSPLSLSVTPSVSSKAVVAAHVIPRLDLGVSGLAGLAQATVFLNLDASASMTLTLDADANAAVTSVDGGSQSNSASVSGCIDIGAGLAVSAGADAKFFGLFDPSTKVDLFTKKFDLFKKCLGKSKPKRRDAFAMESSLTRRVDLGCPAALANLVKAVDEKIPSASIVGL